MIENISPVSTREKIILTTLELIKQEGFQNVTVRKIASIANVNIASINYHFGSKDAVINEALKQVVDELMQCFTILETYDLKPEFRIKKFLQDYSDVISNYPDIIKSFISLMMNNSEASIPYRDFLKQKGFKLIHESIKQIHPNEDKLMTNMRVLQLFSCTGYPILIGSHLYEVSSFDFYSKEQRHKYIEMILNSILK